jgi:vesicle coat complex subunit
VGFYDLNKEQRKLLVEKISNEIISDLDAHKGVHLLTNFADEDTYIRKTAYITIGRIYKVKKETRLEIIKQLDILSVNDDAKVRQTVINAAGEIGLIDFNKAEPFMERGLFDKHHSVRNAVIGSIKKMGEKNPIPVLDFAKRYLHHGNAEVRREICHGIELFGRTHPADILPLLKELQHEKTARVRNTIIHVIGQISYKKDCLETVIEHLNIWENTRLVKNAIDEIIDVHERYKNFTIYTREQAVNYIEKHVVFKMTTI